MPLHASYILQPFDLSMFGPIKTYYCTAIGNLIYQLDNCPMDKRSFLECYSKVRQRGLNEKNVLAGWKATGLWPINRAKPLMSRLVFDTAKLQSIELQQLNQAQIEPDQTQPNIQIPAIQPRKIVVVIPKRSAEIGPLLRRLAPKV